MSFPGPGGPALALGLLLFGAALALVGEAIRSAAQRWVPLFRAVEPVERLLLDLGLGIGLLYALAAVPPGGFYPETLPAATAVAVVLLLVLGRGRLASLGSAARAAWARRSTQWVWPLLAICTGLALFLLESVVAQGQATGNTFDSSVYTTYVALLNVHHALPLTFAPVAPYAIAYPQGSAVVFAAAQDALGLEPARTALLVTPLFVGLAPLGAYALGRRATGSAPMGTAFALGLGLMGEWPRTLVAGSNDFILALPLVLLAWSWIPVTWAKAAPAPLGSVIGFGVVLGISAALNPVGAEATVLALVLILGARAFRIPSSAVGGFSRLLAAVAIAIVPVIPSLAVLAGAAGALPPVASAGPTPPVGTVLGDWVGRVDPFLFRNGNDTLSSFPALRAELAVLLAVGALLLVATGGRARRGPVREGFGVVAVALAVPLCLLLAFESLPDLGLAGLSGLVRLSSSDELSWLLFTLYTALAAVPIGLLLHWAVRPPDGGDRERPRPAGRARAGGRLALLRSPTVALALAALLLVPGIAITVTELPASLPPVYAAFGNVSAGDFALLHWAHDHLPDGARVVVAPGSAAEFLPGYQPTVVLLYPMVVFGSARNASYALVVAELSNATLDAEGVSAMDALHAGYVAVTGNNTRLWPAFSPSPLLAEPRATLLFHEQDAYLFAWSSA